MSTVDQTFIKAFKAVLREQLLHQHSVTLKGIGTWRLKHRMQYQEQHEDGRVVMHPPKDYVEFIPENTEQE